MEIDGLENVKIDEEEDEMTLTISDGTSNILGVDSTKTIPDGYNWASPAPVTLDWANDGLQEEVNALKKEVKELRDMIAEHILLGHSEDT